MTSHDITTPSPNKRARFSHLPTNEEKSYPIVSHDSQQEPPSQLGTSRRKLVSVFSSNQSIHKLTEKIVRSYSNNNNSCQDDGTECHDGHQGKSNNQEEGNDVDTLHKAVRKDSDEVEVTESNLMNPFIDYPHLRHLCGVYKFENDPKKFCDKCFCKVCDSLAKQCVAWDDHCNACDTTGREDVKKSKATNEMDDQDIICLDDDDNDDYDDDDHDDNSDGMDIANCLNLETQNDGDHDNDEQVISDGFLSLDENDLSIENNYDHHFDTGDKDLIGQKSRKDARITDVLSHNLRQLTKLSIANISTKIRNGTIDSSQIQKMQGDIPQLNLHSSFFVEGVRVGWPYPAIMRPQRQMAMHLVKAFKNQRHVVIESPTGTGKSAAILCSALAWQRYDIKTNNACNTTKIIYCSRTHSQVAQMVSSLKKTPYRPRMAILGSRDRLCIHRDIRPRNGVDSVHDKMKSKDNVNNACQLRVGNTEAYRKNAMNSRHLTYSDDNPPFHHPGDGKGSHGGVAEEVTRNNIDMEEDERESEREDSGWIASEKSKMCPHYRQLTSVAFSKKAFEAFVPDRERVNCCSIGGDKTKFGAHDIEDLVKFSLVPNVKKGIALYRATPGSSYGLKLKQTKGERGPVTVNTVHPCGAAAIEGTIREEDTILSINKLDVSGGYELSDVSDRIRKAQDPLLIDVYNGDVNDVDENGYSVESACPYYLSRALANDAELLFCPYNYVLDPNIRKSLEINIKNSVVVLDEAHNVEDTLRQEGSGKFGEIELLEMNVLLSSYASRWKPPEKNSPYKRTEESLSDKIPGIAHDLLVFLDKIIDIMRQSRHMFENNQGKHGVASVTEEYRTFKCSDDKEFEMTYNGPNGSGDGNDPVGCKRFFSQFSINQKEIENIQNQMNSFHEHIFSKNGDERSETRNKLADRLSKIITTLCAAFHLSEHYYISTVITANGNLEFATGSIEGYTSQYKRKPRSIPQNPPRTSPNQQPLPRICNHPSCNIKSRGTISHDAYCDGTTPRWESHLIINLLSPAILMAPLLKDSRSVVLASGSLAPIDSLCSELHLLPSSDDPKENTQTSQESSDDQEAKVSDPLAATSGRLQVTPQPLEADHVIDLNKQLLTVSVGHFPDGSQLSVTYSNYNKTGFHHKLGHAIAQIVDNIPYGGILVFLPSFSFLRKCVSTWQNSDIWQRLLRSKGEVIVEPSLSQDEFEAARDLFNRTIEKTKKCVLLAVFRGKMSEGVSFNDDYARGVICVGVPFPSYYDRSISAKMAYNNEQRKFRSKALLTGNEWYKQQAYRAIAQAIGRCIRHAADYGTIFLLDSRHCDDGHSYHESGICRSHTNLPKWMRNSVRTLRKDMRPIGRNDLLGGWESLQKEMGHFFQKARTHSAVVLEKQQHEFKMKQNKDDELLSKQDLTFDHRSGQ